MTRSSDKSSANLQQGLAERGRRFLREHAHLLMPLAFTAGFSIISLLLVSHFYATRIPHYDSVGSLMNAARILAEFERAGWGAAMALGWDLSNLSILQMMFVALLSFGLEPYPEYFQIYNIVFLIAMTVSVAQLGRTLGFTPVACVVFVAGFLLPDALYWWDIGVLDFRRDFAFYALIVSAQAALLTTFLSLGRGDRVLLARGAALGVLAGLLLISRDNSPTYGFILIAVPAAVLSALAVLRGRVFQTMKAMGAAFVGFLPFLILFSQKLGGILERLGNEFLYYGVGGDRLESFTGLFARALNASFGGISFVWNENRFSTLVLLLLFCALIGGYALFRRNTGSVQTRFSRRDVTQAAALALLGLYSFFAVYGLLTLGAGMRTNMPLIQTTAPLLSSTIVVGWLVGAALVLLRAYAGFDRFRAFGLAAAALVLAALPVRASDRMFNYPDGYYASHEQLAEIIEQIDGVAVIAELEKSLFRIPAIQYYAVRAGRPVPARLYFEHEGVTNDFTGSVIEDPEQRAAVFASMRRAILCEADLILLEARMELYEEPDGYLLLSRYGAPLINDLRSTLSEAPRQVFVVGDSPTAEVIDNTGRTACPSATPS